MGGLELLALSVALGTDLFSVAIPIGMNRVRRRMIVRAAAVFALFHIVMILTGYHLGRWLGMAVEYIGSYHSACSFLWVENSAGILGAAVLAGLGVHMLFGCGETAGRAESRPLQGWALAVLALSVSVDALAAGLSMGMMDVDLIKLSLVLGTVIFLIAIAGLGLGRRAGRYLGSRAEPTGGLVLIALAAHILWSLLA